MASVDLKQLVQQLQALLKEDINSINQAHEEVTIEVSSDRLLDVATRLRDEDDLKFEQLIDLCGVDYSEYGFTNWETTEASGSGFSRGAQASQKNHWEKPRFAVVIHLLSITNNWRLRVKVFVEDKLDAQVPSLTGIWSSASWYEREAFDLFGIHFAGHDDLRRILTDYGFVGHPFRKDFPLIGNVEMRYDATEGRCIYEPVSIEPRVLVPRIIRADAEENTKQAPQG